MGYFAHLWLTYAKHDVPRVEATGLAEKCEPWKDQYGKEMIAAIVDVMSPGQPMEFEFEAGTLQDVRCTEAAAKNDGVSPERAGLLDGAPPAAAAPPLETRLAQELAVTVQVL